MPTCPPAKRTVGQIIVRSEEKLEIRKFQQRGRILDAAPFPRKFGAGLEKSTNSCESTPR